MNINRLFSVMLTGGMVSCVVQVPATPAAAQAGASSGGGGQQEVAPPAPVIVRAEAYTGTVGGAKVRAELVYYSDGKVQGNYVSFNSGKKYQLRGNNYFADKLVLDEYTLDSFGEWRKTSVSDLRKSGSGWEGTMRNTDGRNVPVKLKKAG